MGNKEGDGDSNGEVMGNGDSGDGGRWCVTTTRAMAMAAAMTWAMATAMRVVGDIEGNRKGGKGNGDGNKGGGQQRG